jgi:lipid-A-disaccharide synthase
MKYHHIFLIAGEPSGDLLGARLISALRIKTNDGVHISGIGGPEMEKQGLKSFFPMSELAVMGVTEVLPRLPHLLRRIKETVLQILKNKPNVVVTIDAPDFSLRVARGVFGKGIPLIHYVAPSVWAWKPGRAAKMANLFDHLLTLLPFEPPYFEQEGLIASFVGHSVIESGADKGCGVDFRTRHHIPAAAKVLCILPGSRHSEVSKLLPIIRESLLRLNHSELYVILPTIEIFASSIRIEVRSWNTIPIVVTGDVEKYSAFDASNAAIAASGTVSLELAMARVPYVTIYKFSVLTAFIGRLFVKTPFVNIINILLRREVVPELIQSNCKSDIIASHIARYLDDPEVVKTQIESFAEAIIQLKNGNKTPSEKAADVVLEVIDRNS